MEFDADVGPQSTPADDVLDVAHVKKEDAGSVSTPGKKNENKSNRMNSNNKKLTLFFYPFFILSHFCFLTLFTSAL